jgi:hypothetical protein
MLARAGSRVPTCCPSTLYATLAHTFLGSVPPPYEALQKSVASIRPRNTYNQQVGAIENA